MDYLKYAQCFYMCKLVSRYVFTWAKTYGREWADIAIILGGDLNALPDQSVMGMIFDMEYVMPDEPNYPCELAKQQYIRIHQAY